jgi:hypothetical protein
MICANRHNDGNLLWLSRWVLKVWAAVQWWLVAHWGLGMRRICMLLVDFSTMIAGTCIWSCSPGIFYCLCVTCTDFVCPQCWHGEMNDIPGTEHNHQQPQACLAGWSKLYSRGQNCTNVLWFSNDWVITHEGKFIKLWKYSYAKSYVLPSCMYNHFT